MFRIVMKLFGKKGGSGKDDKDEDKYGEKYVDLVSTVSEIEVIIGIVTVSLILIYELNFWYALGTAFGFFIIEALTLLVLSIAENVVQLRKQVDRFSLALAEAGIVDDSPVLTALKESAAAGLAEEANEDEDEGNPWPRIIGISLAIIAVNVLIRYLTG